MERFVILAVKKQGDEVEALKEVFCGEERAVRECMNIFRTCGMHKVILVDSGIAIRFKDTRICKCPNVQMEMVGMEKGNMVYRNTCTTCGVVIDYDAWMSDKGVEIDVKEIA